MSARLRTSRLASPVTALGPGRRVVVWVQGCTLACPGCASTDTWDAQGGADLLVDDLVDRVVDLALADGATGLTVSGGEPFQQPDAVAALVRGVRERLPGIDVLVFSGYASSVARATSPALFEAADALVLGRYDRRLPHGGGLLASSNQELVLRTALAEQRHGTQPARPRLQVTADGSDLFVVGLPPAGDLDRFAAALARRGVLIGERSWADASGTVQR